MSARPTRSLRLAFVLAVLIGGLLPAAVDAATVTVRLDQGLNPRTITIAPGTTVRWVNESDNRYRMRSRNGPVEFDSGNIEPGESYSFTFTRSGTYPYLDDRDRDDPAFHGTITVSATTPAETAPPAPNGNAPAGGGGGAAPTSATIRMAGRTFSPSAVTIAAGGSVTFVNDDDREHTATGDSFDTGVLNSGAQSKETFPSASTFSFLCQIHPDMRGTVNVRGSSGAAPPAEPAPTPTPPTPTPQPVAPDAPAFGNQAASIVDFAFEPVDIEVLAGTTVSWQNNGAAPHTVTADDGSFDSALIPAGGSWSRTFDAPGRYAFACQFHPEMVGTVIVGAAAAGSTSPNASAPASPSSTLPATTPSSAPDVAGGPPAEPPAAAAPVPDASSPVSEIRDGAFRLLFVGILIAGAVIAFGLLVAGTTRRSRAHHGR